VRGLGGDLVVGRQAVRELLRAGRRPAREVWLADGNTPAEVLDEIAALAGRAGVAVRRVPRERLASAAGVEAHQGVLARAQPVAEVPLADLTARRPGQPRPFLLLLDGVTDPHNLGAILRTAACAGATGVVLPRHRASLVTPTVTKAAAGAIEYLPICVAPGAAQAAAAFGAAGVWSVGLEPDGPASVFELTVATEPLALVLGSEGRGLSRLVRARCDVLARIPQAGVAGTGVGSLNVAAAAAVACFAVSQQRASAPPV
jgi:23S rRNA (guanosine2251-2'-O)-methyltransferase